MPLVIDVENPEILGGLLATMAKQAFRMSGTEMPEDDIVTLINDFLLDYTHEPIEDFVTTIINIRKGKYKVYGKVTSDLFRKAWEDTMNRRIDDRDRINANHKDDCK